MTELPNLAGIATANLVEKIGGAGFQASYINWARTVQMLREHAPGWMPELVRNTDGGILHRAPAGAYLLIRFRHTDGTTTTEVPQAVMDTRNNSVPLEKVSARDITDTHRRGVCMAAAFTFGLAYELWAKMPLENGFADEDKPAANEPEAPRQHPAKVTPMDGVWDAQTDESKEFLLKLAAEVVTRVGNDPADAHEYLEGQQLATDEKAALWSRLDSKTRSALKKAHSAPKEKAA